MKEELHIFLESDLLEKYLLGTTTDEETLKVQHFIDTYPEASTAYDALQEDLERYSRTYAVKAPHEVKDAVMGSIRSSRKETSSFNWLAMVASVAAIFFAVTTMYYRNTNTELEIDNAKVLAELDILKSSLEQSDMRFAEVQAELEKLRNPDTRKYVLRGNRRAKKLKTVAYVNATEKLSLINVIDLPELPEDKVFQMWADVNGKMVSLGILEKADNKLMSIPYKENASSYNITIEPKGGNDHATVENLVANIDFTNRQPLKD